MYFRRGQAPAQRAVGDCSPLKESPGRGPASGQNFSELLVKMSKSVISSWTLYYFVIFTYVFWIKFEWQSWKLLRSKNIFQKYEVKDLRWTTIVLRTILYIMIRIKYLPLYNIGIDHIFDNYHPMNQVLIWFHHLNIHNILTKCGSQDFINWP